RQIGRSARTIAIKESYRQQSFPAFFDENVYSRSHNNHAHSLSLVCSVHLKIFVPDVTNHHVHTRTVLLHLRVPAPKKPKVYKTHDYHHANWSSWKYGRHRDYEHEHENEDPDLDQENHHEDHEQKLRKNRPANHKQKYFPVYDYYKDSRRPPSYIDDNDLELKDRDKDTYAVHEDVNDILPNTETVAYDYEEGYRKGLETETGHVRSDRMHKFHEDQEEEQGDAENEGFKEELGMKTDSGRYLVDDVEYENTRDKRDHRRRSRKRIDKAPRIINHRRNRNK
ncbi:unnamed protein product, partial [Heterotrigona itama]